MNKPTITDVYQLPMDGAETEESAAEGLLAAWASDDEDEETTEGLDRQDSDEETDEGEEPEDDDSEEEEDADEEEEEEETEEPTFEVTLPGGEKARVTQTELLAGYSRTADYTRKTQALAQERETVRAEAATTAQARTQYAQRLQALEVALTSLAPPEPDWDKLRQENPAEFAAQHAEHQRHREQMAAIAAEQQRVAEEQAKYQQTQLSQVLQVERQRLVQAIPEWADPAKAQAEKTALADYAKTTYGFTDRDINGVYDHRVMLLLRKAKLFDELQTRGKKVVKEKVKTAPVLKPGGKGAPGQKTKTSAQRKQSRRAMNSLVQSGSVNDAARVLMEIMPDD